jgi:hypothetical protein
MTINLEVRKASLSILLPTAELAAVEKAATEAGGDLTKAIVILRLGQTPVVAAKIERANALADWASDDVDVLSAVKTDEVPSLRELALQLGDDKLKALLPSYLPAEIANARVDDLRGRLFVSEPTASYQRMASAGELKLDDPEVEKGVAQFLVNLPDFDFRTTDLVTAIADPNAFTDVPAAKKAAVIDALKALQKSIQEMDAASGPAVISKPLDVQVRIAAIGNLLTNDQKSELAKALTAANGDWESAQLALTSLGAGTADEINRLGRANALAGWAGDDANVVQTIVAPFVATTAGTIPTLQEIALQFGLDNLATIFPGANAAEKMQNAVHARRSLFEVAATEVIRRMLGDKELPLKDEQAEDGTNVSGNEIALGIEELIKKLTGFDIHTTNIPQAVESAETANPGVLGTITDVVLRFAIGHLGWFQNLVPFVSIPEVLAPLIKKTVTSAADLLSYSLNEIVSSITEPAAPTEGEAQAEKMVAKAQGVVTNEPAAIASIIPQLGVMSAMLERSSDKGLLEKFVKLQGGDLTKTLELVKEQNLLPKPIVERLESAHNLSEWAGNRSDIVKSLIENNNMRSLSDIAMSFNVDQLAAALPAPTVAPAVAPAPMAAAPASVSASALAPASMIAVSAAAAPAPAVAVPLTDNRKAEAKSLLDGLWNSNRFERLYVMNRDNSFNIANKEERDGVAKAMKNLIGTDVTKTSVHGILNDSQTFAGVDEAQVDRVKEFLPRIVNISNLGLNEVVTGILFSYGLYSANQICQMPKMSFVNLVKDKLAPEIASSVWELCLNVGIRTENVAMALRDAMGTGLAIIDGPRDRAARLRMIQEFGDEFNAGKDAKDQLRINWESLFGSLDFCECGECNSVYSPAAYFVELMQYLRHNNLGPFPPNPVPIDLANPAAHNPNIHLGIQNTPLEKLLRRRPDLAEMQLTCANTNTTIPYIDLANEVMESFIAHQAKYHASNVAPKQVHIDVHDTLEDETNAEMLAEPKHTNYKAYCILNNAVHPFTLPYHQPIDVQRVYLQYLKTSRYEILDLFRTPLPKSCDNWSEKKKQRFKALHDEAQQRAVDAEFFGITQEEYIILTKNAFKPQAFYSLTQRKRIRKDEYEAKIGVLPVEKYFGYADVNEMLSLDEFARTGLTFVKKEFLPRTGLTYAELVDLLRTRFVNRNYLIGRDLEIFQSLRFSYRYLQSLVNTSSTEPEIRFARVVQAISDLASIPEIKDALMAHPELLSALETICEDEAASWVHRNFESIGKLIVLADGPAILFDSANKAVGTLRDDGTLFDKSGKPIGKLKLGGVVTNLDGTPFATTLLISDAQGISVGQIDGGQLFSPGKVDVRQPQSWLPTIESCDSTRIRIIHLDGTSLEGIEYDRIHRFIRLWRKLGWTMQEVDIALMVNRSNPHACHWIDFDKEYGDDCEIIGGRMVCKPRGTTSYKKVVAGDITPKLMHELVAIRKIVDDTGLRLEQVLAFWGNINTAGEKSLYERLFLTHDLRRMDDAFKPDADGNYLTKNTKLSRHLGAIQAAFIIRNADDLFNIVDFLRSTNESTWKDRLTLENVSAIYRFWQLKKICGFKTTELKSFRGVFENIFESPVKTWQVIKEWRQISDTGVSFAKFNYMLSGNDEPLHPVAPPLKTVLQITQKLTEGLSAIKEQHADIGVNELLAATNELVEAKLGLYFDNVEYAGAALGLMNGSTVYTFDVPPLLGIVIQSPLSSLASYKETGKDKAATAKLTIKGILSPADVVALKSLSPNEKWIKAVDRAEGKARKDFTIVFSGLFPLDSDRREMESVILAPDHVVQPNEGEEFDPRTSTDFVKRHAFLRKFLPVLRQFLSKRLVVETMASGTKISPEVTEVLLTNIVSVRGQDAVKTPLGALDVLQGLQDDVRASNGNFTGYLVPPSDGEYRFYCETEDPTKPAPLHVDGVSIEFQPLSDYEYWTEPQTLKGGVVYDLNVNGIELSGKNGLKWKSNTGKPANIPNSSIYPAYDPAELTANQTVIRKLAQIAIVIDAFALSQDEVRYFAKITGRDDDLTIDFNAIKKADFLRLVNYAKLRDRMKDRESGLLKLFIQTDAVRIASVASALLSVTEIEFQKLVRNLGIDVATGFRNEINLLRIDKLAEVASRCGADVSQIFRWVTMSVPFKPYPKDTDQEFHIALQVANEIRRLVRSRYTQTEWEQVVKPLNDQLRRHMRDALIAYLLVQPDLIADGVFDANSLFEFFLIDMQMEPEMLTSRMVQATSTVQLFVQRCFLGLEDKKDIAGKPIGVPLNALDRDRWKWMQRYRVWEANRKVFLYPENWIQPSLRDDKSPFFRELESELLQRDVNPQTIQDAIKNYVFKLDDIANLKVVGFFLEQDEDKHDLKWHVFGRTRQAPFLYFYRCYNVVEKSWFAWERMQVDIPSYDSERIVNGHVLIDDVGTFLIPVVWNGRLIVFFPHLIKKTANQNSGNLEQKKFKDIGNENSPSDVKPIEFWDIKMAYSEYRGGRWTPKQLSKDSVRHLPFRTRIVRASDFRFVPRIGTSEVIIELLPLKQRKIQKAQVMVSRDLAKIYGDISDFEDIDVGMLVEGNRIRPNTTIVRIAQLSGQFYEFDLSQPVVNSPTGFTNEDLMFTDSESKSDSFVFDRSLRVVPSSTVVSLPRLSFHYRDRRVYSLQMLSEESGIPPRFGKEPYFRDDRTIMILRDSGVDQIFSHPFSQLLVGALNKPKLSNLYDLATKSVSVPNNPSEQSVSRADAFGLNELTTEKDKLYHELRRPYSLYNWELGFHAPMMLSEQLLNAQQFDLALEVAQIVFDPNKSSDSSDDPSRVWNFIPFQETNAKEALTRIFNGLKSNAPDPEIEYWRDHPFSPHGIARMRPSAYMKWTVMQYIRILIAYGDHYFRMNTLEFIPMAIQCYVMAAHLYGEPGQKIPRRGKIKPVSYNDLLDSWDSFSNAVVPIELMLPASNQTPLPIHTDGDKVGIANIFGFATTRYFCIPNNPMLTGLRETIDDRLFKVRHSLDINGVFRQLPLFEPPIDPALLVQATAQGLSLSSVLNDLNSPMPNYRFVYLLQKAMELCAELKSLGNAFLSTKEKRDAESLSRLRAQHESSIHTLVMETKKLQLEESKTALEALQENRKAPESRMGYYLRLIGEEISRLPDFDSDFTELPNNIEKPVDESGLKLIRYEKEEMDRAKDSADVQASVGAVEALANVLSLVPDTGVMALPFGIGVDLHYGGQQLGPATSAIARLIRIGADHLSFQSSSASRKAGHVRGFHERIHQTNQAGRDIKSIDKQILAQRIRVNIAEQEITNQQKQIDNAQEVDEFLRNKYTNDDLYSYMEGSLRTLYYQTYTLAYDLAKKAERAFQFERVKPTQSGSQTASNFIQFGYWDAAHDGLLSGEKLYLALKQLETAYQAERGYDYEIVKQVSLRQLAPSQLVALRHSGKCEFKLPEALFDLDYPGHFMRRIKSISLTVPCVVGPYTGLNCSLKLTKNEFRKQGISSVPYPKKTDEDDDRFATSNVPIKAIAVSTGQNDSGVFELNFRDERYLPFEGAGAISEWSLELPEIRQFDYETIADVVLTVRYTSVDGGDALKVGAQKSVDDALANVEEQASSTGVFVAFDLKHDFASQWIRFSKAVEDGGDPPTLDLANLSDHLPFIAKNWEQKNVKVTQVYVAGQRDEAEKIKLLIDGEGIGELNDKGIIDVLSLEKWKLQRDGTKAIQGGMWLIVQLALQK